MIQLCLTTYPLQRLGLFETIFTYNFAFIFNVFFYVKGGDLQLILLVSIFVSSSWVTA